ncbi:MAG: enolase C-terminal domain-like protein [Rhodospirillales bacterium]|nr:enolase C-terminal domain-like protein [Rhodospirillales bacterium]
MFKISKIDSFGVGLPLKAPIKMSSVVIGIAENIIVRIEDSDGTIGWGEATEAPTMTGESVPGMLAAVKFLTPLLTGREIEDLPHIHAVMDDLMYGNHGAKSAIEIALLDLSGKRLGKPLYEILGGKVRDEAPILVMLAGGDKDAEVANAKQQADQGFVAFKVKIGALGPSQDLDRSRAARDVLGNSARISADANQGYSRDEALMFSEGAADAGLDFMEQLVDYRDLDGMAACAQASKVPLGADEGFHAMSDILEHKDRGAAHGGSLKTIKLGGAFPVMEAGRVMDTMSMHVNLAGKVADSSIASAAIAHLALCLPQVNWDTSITNQYLAEDLVDDPIKIIDGVVRLSDAPGLGVAPSDALLQKYKIS